MSNKPPTSGGYTSEQLTQVRSLCLYVATKLGDLMDDLVIIGGLAPSLLIEPSAEDGVDEHVGTMDLDVALAVALLEEKRYTEFADRLRAAGFVQDQNEKGNPTSQRWKFGEEGNLAIDFLIQPTRSGDRGGRLRHIEDDFAAIIVPGLQLAFEDRTRVTLSDETIKGARATRDIWVCGAGAYVVLKALAFRGRGENKDAYDLYYVVSSFGSGPADVAAALRPLMHDGNAREALTVLKTDFLDLDGLGARGVAEFLTGGTSDDVQADVVGYVGDLVRLVEEE